MGYNPCNYGHYGYLIHLLQQVAGGLLTQLYINGITQEEGGPTALVRWICNEDRVLKKAVINGITQESGTYDQQAYWPLLSDR